MAYQDYDAAEFGKVAVLMGGQSAERNISLESGQAVLTALLNSDIDAHAIDYSAESLLTLIEDNFDRVFIALHGRGGEDGTVQGALESIGLPYTGSGVLGSALAMDKSRSKSIWQQAGLSTPLARELDADTDWEAVVEQLGLPLMVKPVHEGSSLGASKVSVAENLSTAWQQANQYDNRVMAERWIEGQEYTVPILHSQVLPLIKLVTAREFYDYHAKYEADDTQYICPCGLEADKELSLGEMALAACQSLNVSGWARVDLLIDSEGQAFLIEVNTVPGMTSHSLVPMAAKQAGLSFEQLVVQILATSLTFNNATELSN